MNILSSFTVYTAALHALILILFSLHTSGLGYPGLTLFLQTKGFHPPKQAAGNLTATASSRRSKKHSAETTINFSAVNINKDTLNNCTLSRGGEHGISAKQKRKGAAYPFGCFCRSVYHPRPNPFQLARTSNGYTFNGCYSQGTPYEWLPHRNTILWFFIAELSAPTVGQHARVDVFGPARWQ